MTTTLLVQFEDTAVSNSDGDPLERSLCAVGMDCDIRHDANYAYGAPARGMPVLRCARRIGRNATRASASGQPLVLARAAREPALPVLNSRDRPA